MSKTSQEQSPQEIDRDNRFIAYDNDDLGNYCGHKNSITLNKPEKECQQENSQNITVKNWAYYIYQLYKIVEQTGNAGYYDCNYSP